MRFRQLVVGILTCLVAAAASTAAADGEFEFALNDEAVDLRLLFLTGGDEDGRFAFGGRYLNSDEDDIDASIPALIAGFLGSASSNERFDFFVGVQGMFGEALDEDVSAAAVGGAVAWTPEFAEGLLLAAEIYWAPDSLSFGDTEDLINWQVKAGYEVTKRFQAHVSYHELEVEVDDVGEIDVDDSARIGVTLKF
ncbi:MAG: hypothetical protein GY716_04120 [bacterium]|nr:hypothetical protein [bacterium]